MEKLSGSVQKGLNQTIFYDLSIKVLKSEIMLEHRLEELFNNIDELKNQIEQDKKTYDKELKSLFDWNNTTKTTKAIVTDKSINKTTKETHKTNDI